MSQTLSLARNTSLVHVHQPANFTLPSSEIALKPPKPHLFIDFILNFDFLEPLLSRGPVIFARRSCLSSTIIDTKCYF